VLLQPSQVVDLCTAPANAAAIAQGRRLERVHRLHLEGTPDLLGEFISTHALAATPAERKTLLEVGVEATVPKYGAYTQLFNKVFTARGSNQYFEFSTPQDQQDFEEYLTRIKFQERLRKKFEKVSYTGFQGCFLVDLPSTVNDPDALPEPYWQYISSSQLHDAEISGDTYEYVIIKQSEVVEDKTRDYFVCFDDLYAHVVVPADGGKLAYSAARTTQHGLGYVPAFTPTLFAARSDSDVVRTSILHKSLPVAKVYLLDHLMHQLDKNYHGFRKFWSYGVPCTHVVQYNINEACGGEALYTTVACQGGDLLYPDGTTRTCSKCNGFGRVIPVGPDKVYIVEPAPQGETSVVDPGPAGYIEPDIATSKEQREEISVQERQLEQAVLGKEGILNRDSRAQTAAGQAMDLQPVFDRCDAYGQSWKWVLKNVIDTMARLRYDASFRDSAINIGTKYGIETIGELEAGYAAAKASGYPDSALFGMLEDVIYTKYSNDPMELEYNRIKLYLEPVPTRSTAEVQQWVYQREGDQELIDLFRRKRNLNDYVARFERDNGPLVQFGVRQPFATRIDTILATFKEYDNESVPA
jgi:hypothetical protein